MFKSLKTGILALILTGTAVFAQAQKKVSEGSITLTSEYLPTSEQEAMVSMLPTEVKLKFNGTFVKYSFDNGPASITTIQDVANHEGLTLIDVPVAQMQLAVKNDKAAYEQSRANGLKFSDFKATGEKKTISGFQTEKYTYKDDKGNSYELWATTDIELPSGLLGEDFKSLNATPVKFTTSQQGIKVTQTIKGISEEKVGKISLEIPSGYELKTMEEIMAMQGGGE